MLELVTDDDAARLLLNPKAAVVLGISAVLAFAAAIFVLAPVNYSGLTGSQRETVYYVAVVLALGTIVLFLGMALFLFKCDIPARRGRFGWFLALMIAQSYATIPYYLLVYLPAMRRAETKKKR